MKLNATSVAIASATFVLGGGAAVNAHDKEVALLVQRSSERPFVPVQLG